MSREKSEKVCITFRLSEEEHEKLKQYSSACGLSTAEFMRQLCVNVNILLYKKWKIFLYNYRCYASAS